MHGIARASPGLVALTLCAYAATANPGFGSDPDPAWRQTAGISELTEILETWLDDHTAFERRDVPLEITTISASTAASMRGKAGRGHGRTRGLYDPETSTIYLVQPWNPENAKDTSVLLHELVHHRQVAQQYYCPGAQEEAAYRLQDDWLRERGMRADVNWIAVVLAAGCTPRDIHPD